MGVSLRSCALGEASVFKSLVWIEYCRPIPDLFVRKSVMQSYRGWWSWGHVMSGFHHECHGSIGHARKLKGQTDAPQSPATKAQSEHVQPHAMRGCGVCG